MLGVASVITCPGLQKA